jgi:hypothetical protein
MNGLGRVAWKWFLARRGNTTGDRGITESADMKIKSKVKAGLGQYNW